MSTAPVLADNLHKVVELRGDVHFRFGRFTDPPQQHWVEIELSPMVLNSDPPRLNLNSDPTSLTTSAVSDHGPHEEVSVEPSAYDRPLRG